MKFIFSTALPEPINSGKLCFYFLVVSGNILFPLFLQGPTDNSKVKLSVSKHYLNIFCCFSSYLFQFYSIVVS
jgi:hypothetical protein